MNIPKKWCIQGCRELQKLLNPKTNVIGNKGDCYYYNQFSENLLESRKWSYFHEHSDKKGWQIITVEEFERYILNQPEKSIDLW